MKKTTLEEGLAEFKMIWGKAEAGLLQLDQGQKSSAEESYRRILKKIKKRQASSSCERNLERK